MSLITRMRRQKAVYWAKQAEVSESGAPIYGAPVEISCRWVDKVEQFLGPLGEVQLSRAIVYVDREMKVGDVLWKGLLADVPSQDDPKRIEGAWELRAFSDTPNIRASEFLLKATL